MLSAAAYTLFSRQININELREFSKDTGSGQLSKVTSENEVFSEVSSIYMELEHKRTGGILSLADKM